MPNTNESLYVPSSIMGFKAMRLAPSGRLVSPVYESLLSPGWNKFSCSCPKVPVFLFSRGIKEYEPHTSLEPHSTCGWYAGLKPDTALDYGSKARNEYLVLIEGKGTVFKGDDAFRSEYARVVAIAPRFENSKDIKPKIDLVGWIGLILIPIVVLLGSYHTKSLVALPFLMLNALIFSGWIRYKTKNTSLPLSLDENRRRKNFQKLFPGAKIMSASELTSMVQEID